MTRKLTTLYAASALLAGIGGMTAAFADEATPPSSAPHATHGMGMMGNHAGMSMMGQMSPDQMKQMSRMVDDCNRMMENKTTTPTTPGTNTPRHPG